MKAYVWDLAPERVPYYGAPYFGETIFACGDDTLESVEAGAHHAASVYMRAVPFAKVTGRWMARVKRPCATCKVSGIKPGCKRKACPSCEGKGSTVIAEYMFTLAG